MSDLAYLSLASAKEAIRDGSLCPVDYVSALLSRIETFDSSLNSFLYVDAERALTRARSLRDARRRTSVEELPPLFGIPYSVKDIIDVEGLVTTGQSRVMSNSAASANAAIVDLMEQAGGILLGKNSLYEFAIGGPTFDLPWPPARNPWNRDYMAGSSSSGSGVAVAAGFVPLSIGSDTGGSVRSPASMNGVVGFKPTYGSFDTRGVFPLAPSLDTLGLLTRSSEDARIVLNATLPQPQLSGSEVERHSRVEGLRIGVVKHFYESDIKCSPDIRNVMDSAIKRLAEAGAKIIEISLSPLARYNAAGWTYLISEAFAIHERWLRERPGEYGKHAREIILSGAFVSAADYIKARQLRTLLIAELNAALHEADIIMTAVTALPPCRIDDASALGQLAAASIRMPFNVTGHPAVSIPAGFSDNGLPVGIQFAHQRGLDGPLAVLGQLIADVIAPTWRPPQFSSADAEIAT